MPFYAVRQIDSHEVVGLIFAKTKDDLFWATDEATNPFECEFKLLPSGSGVVWKSPTEQVFPVLLGSEERVGSAGINLSEAELTDEASRLLEIVDGVDGEGGWSVLFDDNNNPINRLTP